MRQGANGFSMRGGFSHLAHLSLLLVPELVLVLVLVLVKALMMFWWMVLMVLVSKLQVLA